MLNLFISFLHLLPFFRIRRSQVVTDKSGNPIEDQTPRANTYVTMKTNMPASLKPTRSYGSTRCLVTVLDHESFRAAWVYDMMPNWLLSAERWQTLTVLDNRRTRYETREVFGGVLAYIVKFLYQETLNQCCIAMGKALKEVSEQQSNQS
jgi:hypothetical protein